jgi:hypothetical protein
MPSSIIATEGAANANSYIDLAGAMTYFGDRLHKDDWANASANDRTAALLWAAKILDSRVSWNGTKATATQAMDWPRAYVEDKDAALLPPDQVYATSVIYLDATKVPQFVKDAQCELALSLLSADRSIDSDTDGLSALSVGSLSVSYFGGSKKSEATLPKAVRELLNGYGTFDNGSGSKTLKLRRT